MRGKMRVYLYNKRSIKSSKINTQKIQKTQKGNAQKIQKFRAVRADEETQKQQLISSRQIVRTQTCYKPDSFRQIFVTTRHRTKGRLTLNTGGETDNWWGA